MEVRDCLTASMLFEIRNCYEKGPSFLLRTEAISRAFRVSVRGVPPYL